MRLLPVLAIAVLAAALAAGHGAASHSAGGPVPVWALFSFAVSAFREPLR